MTKSGDHHGGRIRALDGLRGVAVLLVVIGHFVGESLRLTGLANTLTRPLQTAGDLGVEIFFALSGFVITAGLLRERDSSGRIDLKSFYVRRAIRIWPVFYSFIAVVAILAILGFVKVTSWEFFAASLFIWDYAPDVDSWWLSHTWSLAIEEQFYLLWPVLLIWLRPKRAVCFCAAGFLLVPLFRLGSYAVSSEEVRQDLWHMFHVRADSLLIGCLLALLVAHHPAMWSSIQAAVGKCRLVFLVAPVLVISQLLTGAFGGVWQLTVGFTIENLAIAVLLIRVMTPGTISARAFTWKPLLLLGLISYSLYIWQQLFLTNENMSILGHPAVAVFASVAAAILSYTFIEKPASGLKKRFEVAANGPGASDAPQLEGATPGTSR